MNDELTQNEEKEEKKHAGGGSLERSERSERSGSEPPPRDAPVVGGPDPAPVPGAHLSPDEGSARADSTPPPEPSGEYLNLASDDVPGLPDETWEDPPPPSLEELEAQETEEPVSMPPNLTARRRNTLSKKKKEEKTPQQSLTPQQKLLLLDTWLRSGLPARDFGAMVNISRHTLYSWKRKFEELGPAGLMEQPKGQKGSRLPELTKRTILMLKTAHPEWGCQRISDLLYRGPALPASPGAVARVLHEAGYEMEEKSTRPHRQQVRSFERAKPNQLWQTDLFTFMLKRQNRRVHLVAFMDDHSRFITGYGLHASQSAALVLEVLRASIAAHGVPAEILTDNGSQYITWRGKSQFTKELEKRGIKQIVARPRRPQTLGKIERFWGSLWRECVESAVFLDLAEARQRIGLWVDYYNLQRPHQGIEGLVPADRFFHAAPEVLKTLKERVAENARDLARNGIPRQPCYLTGQIGDQPFSVHQEGDRVILHEPGKERKEIELKPACGDATEGTSLQEELPLAVCPDGSPVSLWQHRSREGEPGTSPVDKLVESLEANQPEETQHPSPEEEGGVQ